MTASLHHTLSNSTCRAAILYFGIGLLCACRASAHPIHSNEGGRRQLGATATQISACYGRSVGERCSYSAGNPPAPGTPHVLGNCTADTNQPPQVACWAPSPVPALGSSSDTISPLAWVVLLVLPAIGCFVATYMITAHVMNQRERQCESISPVRSPKSPKTPEKAGLPRIAYPVLIESDIPIERSEAPSEAPRVKASETRPSSQASTISPSQLGSMGPPLPCSPLMAGPPLASPAVLPPLASPAAAALPPLTSPASLPRIVANPAALNASSEVSESNAPGEVGEAA